MTAPHPHGIALVSDIKAHAEKIVRRSADLMLNPYQADSDHHALWREAGQGQLKKKPAEMLEGQGA